MEHRVSGVGVLDKSVAVLDAVAALGAASLADLVAATGSSRSTAHRLAGALEVHGLLARDGEGRYVLGRRLAQLGRAAASDAHLVEAARPVLDRLRSATGESAQLYVRVGDERVCLLSLESAHELRTIVPEGAHLALGIGSAGRILAAWDGTERWVASVEERAPGVASVSAPVVVAGELVAAVGISGPVGRLGRNPGKAHGPAVVEAARDLARVLARSG